MVIEEIDQVIAHETKKCFVLKMGELKEKVLRKKFKERTKIRSL